MQCPWWPRARLRATVDAVTRHPPVSNACTPVVVDAWSTKLNPFVKTMLDSRGSEYSAWCNVMEHAAFE
eukprot:6175127-Pleurochrysis_carterae.AAC.2